MPNNPVKPQRPVVNWGHPLARGLVAAYVCAERGGRLVDYARGHHATLNGNPTRTVGPFGLCANLDGTGDYYDAGDSDDFTVATRGFAIAARINPTALSNSNRNWIAAKGDASNYEWAFAVDAGDSNHLYCERWALDGGTGAPRWSSSAISTGVWTSVVGNMASNADAMTPDLYINGALDNGSSANDIAGGTGNGTAAMQIGRRADGGDTTPNGRIDYLYFWNRALTAAEVRQLHYDPWIIVRPPALVAAYMAPAVAGLPPGLGPAVDMDMAMQNAGSLLNW